MDCFGCNAVPTGLTLDPLPFKVGVKVRDQDKLERWIAESEDRTKDL